MSNNVFPDLINVNVISPDPLPTNPTPKDFRLEVQRGNVPGVSLTASVARNSLVGSGQFEDLWGGGNLSVPELTMVYPTAPEVWEVVSTDANDTDGGTGARTLFVLSLDGDLLEQSQSVTLNGLTPVQLTGTHLRPVGIFVLTADQSATGTNIGEIILRVSGGGNARNIALSGIGRSHDTHFTVPANKDGFFLSTQILFPKGGSGKFMNQFRTSGVDAAWNTGSVLSPYQNNVPFPFESLPSLPGGSDLKLQSISDSGSIDVTTIFELYMVDKVI